MSQRRFPLTVKRGNVTVKVYRTPGLSHPRSIAPQAMAAGLSPSLTTSAARASVVSGQALCAVAADRALAARSGDLGAVQSRRAEFQAQVDRLQAAMTQALLI